MGNDKGIDYISHRYALRWMLIRKSIIFLTVMPWEMGFEKETEYISQCNALRNGF